MSRLGQGSDTTACPWCEGNIDPSGGYFSKLDDNHKSHNFQGFTIFSQFSRSPGRLLYHEWARMGTNGLNHERHEKLRTTNGHECTRKESRGLLNHEWTRMDQTTKHTKHTKKTQNHEWTRMGTNGLNHEKYERHEKLRTTNGHEWTRMDYTTKDTKDTKKLRTTNGHEWTRKESRWLLNHEWARISVVRGLLPSLACGLPSTVDGMQCVISSQFAHLPSGESRDGVGILVVDGVSAAGCERSPR